MKKWISFIMIMILSVALIGCGGGKDPVDPDKPDTPVVEDVKPTELVVTGAKEEELEIGESFKLEIKVLPEDAKNKKVRIVSSDSTVATADDNGNVTAVGAGSATITITSLGNTALKKEIKVTVKAGEVVVETPDPETLTISAANSEVEKGKTLTLVVAVTPEGASKAVKWSSSDETVAKVNNGIVVGLEEGEATITATSTVVETLKAEFKIKVIPNTTVVEKIDPTSITVQLSADSVEVGYRLTAKATVYPEGASQNVVWESRNPEIATIDDKGIIRGIAEGTTYITAYSAEKPEVKSSRVKVKVTPEVGGEPIPDLQGYEIVIMNADSALGDIDPFLDAYKGQDKMFKQQAWTEIQKEYNCKVSVKAYPDDAPWGDSRINWINSQAELGQAQADFYTIASSWLYQIAGVGSAHDAKAVYNKYGKNQMDITQKQAATYKGGMYALSTGTDMSKQYIDLGLYYNVAWVERLKLESPAKMFNEGRWTYSNFTKWINDCQALLGDGEKALAGSLYYMWLGMTNTTGVKVADTASVKVTLSHNRSVAVADLLKGLVATGALATTSSWMESSGEFIDGKSVMTSGCWWFMKSDNRWSTDMWGEDTRFGYVPFPYPDDMDKEKIRLAEYGTTLYVFAEGRDSVHPAGVTYDDIYRAMIDLYLRSARYYSEDPSYDPDTLKRNSISTKVDDPESVEAAMWWNNNNVFYDAVQDFYTSPSGSPLTGKIATIIKGGDYQQTMDELEESYVQKFLTIYSA